MALGKCRTALKIKSDPESQEHQEVFVEGKLVI